MKKVIICIWLASILIFATVSGSFAGEQKVSGFASVDVMSNYVWRGIKVSKGLVVQPSVGIGYGNFAANMWANHDSDAGAYDGNGKLTETDITLSYSKTIDKLTLSGGYIYYAFDGFNDTQEFYMTASYDTLLSPALTVYYDFDEGKGAFIIASIGHALNITRDVSLKLGALTSYNINNGIMGFDNNGKKFSNFYNAEVNAAISIPITKALSVTPKVAYSFAISNDAKAAMKGIANDGKDNILYGGVNLTLSF